MCAWGFEADFTGDLNFLFCFWWEEQKNDPIGLPAQRWRGGRARLLPVSCSAGVGGGMEGNGQVRAVMESKVIEGVTAVLEVENGTASTVGGGVKDTYGEDQATQDQPITPWTVSVARYRTKKGVLFFQFLQLFYVYDTLSFL